MEILNLPFPALQCVIEHMVANAGVYRATRLRLVCKLFDDEVTRAIFGSRVIDFDADMQARGAWSHYNMAEYLKGRVMRTHVFKPTAFISTIHEAVELLLQGPESHENISLQRKAYQEALCDAVADTIRPCDTKRHVKEKPGLSADQVKLPAHMLAVAAAAGSIERVQYLLAASPGTSIKSEFFGCAVTNAARIGRDDILSRLLETLNESRKVEATLNPTTPTASDPQSHQDTFATALIVACENDHQIVVQTLLRHTERFEQIPDESIIKALSAAAYNGHSELVQWLLETASFSSREKALCALMLASCSGGHTKLVQTLLASGADVNAHRVDGYSSLCMAATRGHLGVVKLLIGLGAIWRDTPRGDALCLAAANGHEEIVQFILDSGIYYGGESTLHDALGRAALHGETRMVEFLIQKGVDVHGTITGHCALARAVERGFDHTVRLLAEHGAPVHDCEQAGEPMLWALAYGQQHIVKLLLELGAPPLDPLESRLAYEFEEGEFPRMPYKL